MPSVLLVTMTLLPRRPVTADPSGPWSTPAGAGRRPRVALYGHDTLGLGHVRRNLALAAAISESPCEPDVLVISGVAEAGRFPRIPRVDLLTSRASPRTLMAGTARRTSRRTWRRSSPCALR